MESNKGIEMEKWRATLVPQLGMRCKHCTEKQEESTHPDCYTTHTPQTVIIVHSKEAITFREQNFHITSLYIETTCEVCEGINVYPLHFWEESKVEENNKTESSRKPEEAEG